MVPLGMRFDPGAGPLKKASSEQTVRCILPWSGAAS